MNPQSLETFTNSMLTLDQHRNDAFQALSSLFLFIIYFVILSKICSISTTVQIYLVVIKCFWKMNRRICFKIVCKCPSRYRHLSSIYSSSHSPSLSLPGREGLISGQCCARPVAGDDADAGSDDAGANARAATGDDDDAGRNRLF